MDMTEFDKTVRELAAGRHCSVGVEVDRPCTGICTVTFSAYIAPQWFKASSPEHVIRQIKGTADLDLRNLGTVPRS